MRKIVVGAALIMGAAFVLSHREAPAVVPAARVAAKKAAKKVVHQPVLVEPPGSAEEPLLPLQAPAAAFTPPVDMKQVALEIAVRDRRQALAAWRDELWGVYRNLGVSAEALERLGDLGRGYAEDADALVESFRNPDVPVAAFGPTEAGARLDAATRRGDPVEALVDDANARITDLLGAGVVAAVDEARAAFAAERGIDPQPTPEPIDAPLVYLPAD